MKIIYAMLLALPLFQISMGGGTISIMLTKYNNSEGKAADGYCCESTNLRSHCNDLCDHYFKMCLNHHGGPFNEENCPLGRQQTGFIKKNVITFRESIGDTPNPMNFPFDDYPGSFNFSVQVWDSDDNPHDFIDSFSKSITANKNWKHVVASSRTRLEFNVSITCDKNWCGPNCDQIVTDGTCVEIDCQHPCETAGLCQTKKGHDRCYYIFTNGDKTWSQTNELCASNNMTLVKLDHQVLQDQFNLKDLKERGVIGSKVWLGGKVEELQEWTFVNGVPLSSTRSGNISAFGVGEDNYQCAMILSNATIRKTDCHHKFPFICRFDDWRGSPIYQITNVTTTWFEARSFCTSRGADLFFLKENENILFLRNKLVAFQNRMLYIGLTHRTWRWKDGEEVKYYNWLDTEPNSIYEDCMAMYSSEGLWIDMRCDATMSAFCQKVLGPATTGGTTAPVSVRATTGGITAPVLGPATTGGTTAPVRATTGGTTGIISGQPMNFVIVVLGTIIALFAAIGLVIAVYFCQRRNSTHGKGNRRNELDLKPKQNRNGATGDHIVHENVNIFEEPNYEDMDAVNPGQMKNVMLYENQPGNVGTSDYEEPRGDAPLYLELH